MISQLSGIKKVCGPLNRFGSSCTLSKSNRFNSSAKRYLSTINEDARKQKSNSFPSWVYPTVSTVSLFSIAWYFREDFASDLIRSDSNIAPKDKSKSSKVISQKELSKHNKKDDCWVAINGHVYDVTSFLMKHPGGANIILKFAGKDASAMFNKIHPPHTIEKHLQLPDAQKGDFMVKVNANDDISDLSDDSKEEKERLKRVACKPPLSQIYNLTDFEYVASQILPKISWGYYSTGVEDEFTLRENHAAYSRIFFKPKVLVDVTNIDISTNLLGVPSSAPFYISAAASAKLGHPDGELALARGAGKEDIIQMISTQASYSLDDIAGAAQPGQSQWFQLYVNSGPEQALELINKCNENPHIKGLFITVDLPALGNREKDRRAKYGDDPEAGSLRATDFFSNPLTWKDIEMLKTKTDLPIILKGVQRVDDVLKAADIGVQGVILSNHGGRQLDFARAPIEILAEVMPELRQRGLDKKMDVFIDGGVRRGTDVLKALCLGAKGVGLGRPFLYALSGYGEEGVVKSIQILKDEIEMNMRFLGVTKIEDLNEDFIDYRSLHSRANSPSDVLSGSVYQGLKFPIFKDSDASKNPTTKRKA